MTRVAIVVLNWNGIEDTKTCLSSLLAQSHHNYSIVVIDNGSTDHSVKELRDLERKHKDKIILIENSSNRGFAGGVNTGISYVLDNDFDAVALFNNDAVADKNWLKHLVDQLEKSDQHGIVTGLLLHQDGKTIDSTGDYYSNWGMPFPRARNLSREDAPGSGYVFGASGGASLYRADLFRKIGLFDERFFAYYEDVDVSFRAQLSGYKVCYVDQAIAYHKQGATSSKIPGFTVYQTFKNLPLLFIKNIPSKLLLPVGLRFFVLYWLIFGNAIRKGSGWPALKGWLISIWYFWTNSLWKRFAIQRTKKVSSSYIRSIIWPDLPPEQSGLRKLLGRR